LKVCFVLLENYFDLSCNLCIKNISKLVSETAVCQSVRLEVNLYKRFFFIPAGQSLKNTKNIWIQKIV
jgi:hypothetical protein